MEAQAGEPAAVAAHSAHPQVAVRVRADGVRVAQPAKGSNSMIVTLIAAPLGAV
jgi:hypothetical protein